MPLYGQLDVQPIASRLVQLRDLDTPAWTLPGAEILQLAWEVRDETLDLLPRAMHPAVPPYATLVVTSYPESPVGPFNLALLRLMGRAGAHPRGYVVAAVASTPDAVHALRTQWGFPAELGGIALRRYHDQVTAVVSAGRRGVPRGGVDQPRAHLRRRRPVHPQRHAGAAAGRRPTDASSGAGGPSLHLSQGGARAPQGAPFETAGWNADMLAPLHPIAGSIATCDTDLPQIRFVDGRRRPGDQGTRKIR